MTLPSPEKLKAIKERGDRAYAAFRARLAEVLPALAAKLEAEEQADPMRVPTFYRTRDLRPDPPRQRQQAERPRVRRKRAGGDARRQEVLDLLRTAGGAGMPSSEVSARLGLSVEFVRLLLRDLVLSGAVRKVAVPPPSGLPGRRFVYVAIAPEES